MVAKTVFEVAMTDTQCFRDLKTSLKDLVQAGISAVLGPFETKYCYAHVTITDFNSIDLAAYKLDRFGFDMSIVPGGRIPKIDSGGDKCTSLTYPKVKIGLCMPTSCTTDKEIGKILADVTAKLPVSARLCEISCVGPKEEPGATFFLFNIFLTSLFAIVITASILDYFASKNELEAVLKNRTGWKILTSFSAPRNASAIFSTRQRSDSILCLDAFRFITFTWVANGHCDLFTFDGDNTLRMIRGADNIFSQVLLNYYPSVDTFFLISGLLVSYTFFKKVHDNPNRVHTAYDWMMHYAHRWIRLTPAYILFIACFIAWVPRMHNVWASGLTMNTTRYVENCENNWWKNALYINNFDSVKDICFPHSWYLSVDTQFHWAAPLFVIALSYSWKAGVAAAIGAILFSLSSIIFFTAVHDLPALPLTSTAIEKAMDFVFYLYNHPLSRCAPYVIGIICGYFIVQVRTKTITLRQPKKWELVVGWSVSTLTALTVIFSVHDYFRGTSEWRVGVRALYLCFAHVGWPLAVVWVIFACVFDWAGPLKPFLEHPLWGPLGRLSYCAYLGHWFVLHFLLNASNGPTHLVSIWHTYFTLTIPIVVMSFILAAFWSCAVEIPTSKIEAIVIDRLTQRRRENHVIANGYDAQLVSNTAPKMNNDVEGIIKIDVENK